MKRLRVLSCLLALVAAASCNSPQAEQVPAPVAADPAPPVREEIDPLVTAPEVRYYLIADT